jgi:hypothetical protein
MNIPLLVMHIQVFSLDMETRCLTSSEGILTGDDQTEIRIPLFDAIQVKRGPIVGERYFVRYQDGIAQDIFPPEFFYIGIVDHQLIFSSAAMQPA